jgi:NAD(P)-dependent dehydrogenase (short-subunit alcohol dehydrogenase family)
MTVTMAHGSHFLVTVRLNMIVSTGARAITWMNPPGIGRGIAFAVRRSSSQSAGLSKTVALVTGAGSGLGAATARALLGRGARVVVADLSVDALQRDPYFSQFIVVGSGSLPSPAEGPAVTFCPTNVTDPGQVSRALDLAESMYGEPVNAAICCAGIATAEKTVGRRGAHSLESFRSVVEVNLLGSFNVARLAAERMSVRENQTAEQPNQDMNGCIIFTASIAAYDGQVGQVAYAASKAGLVGMTLPMARDLAPHRIRVMTIVRFLGALATGNRIP